MAKRVVKYNPAFLTSTELVESFVVRHDDLELIVQILRENDTPSNQHVLVIGPRGIGKTMLVLRVALEVRRDEHLRDRWYPLVFAEESYQVQTPGEFWLEALFHLRRQTGDDRWKRAHEELVNERDEERLRQRALSQLVDFADSQGKRILLVVENLNMLLGDQISSDDAWTLRHTLQNESRIMLLATATTRFEEVENADKAMFDLFRLHELPPLDEAGCRAIWARTTGQEHDDDRIRPIQILTGGNPRLLTIISAFAARLSFEKLMTDLIQLVDDHTEYFKSHLDNLAPVERKVYLTLAEIWDPATAREVARAARLDVSKTSSLLGRLTDRGAVAVYGQQGRTKSYQVAERMYNIYHLMRRRGAPSKRVKGLVDFMVAFYGPEQLVSLARSIAREACELGPESRQDHYQTYAGLMEHPSTGPLRGKFIDQTPCDFFLSPDTPNSLKQVYQQRQAAAVAGESDLLETRAERLEFLEKARTNVFSASVAWEGWDRQRFWHLLGGSPSFTPERKVEIAAGLEGCTESQLKELAEVLENELRKREELVASGDVAAQLYDAVRNGYMLGSDDVEGAEAAAANMDAPQVATAALAIRFAGEPSVARSEALRAILAASQSPFVWVCWADGASEMGHEYYEEAEAAYRKAIELTPDDARAWSHLGQLLHERLERYEEAEAAYRKAIELKPDYA
ncbi:MAG: tetratricopeptide repeat protein, partial [Planctomycetes bacterium]|nr:tetratricopeptide repeat protein [Planctomycetota bacterium]